VIRNIVVQKHTLGIERDHFAVFQFRELHHFVALAVVTEDHGILAEFGPCRRDAIA
jgi:hypothetical protein